MTFSDSGNPQIIFSNTQFLDSKLPPFCFLLWCKVVEDRSLNIPIDVGCLLIYLVYVYVVQKLLDPLKVCFPLFRDRCSKN